METDLQQNTPIQAREAVLRTWFISLYRDNDEEVGMIQSRYNPVFDASNLEAAQAYLYTAGECSDLYKIFGELGPFTCNDEEYQEDKLGSIKGKIIATWIARNFSATPLVP